jgi:hypothetical protein
MFNTPWRPCCFALAWLLAGTWLLAGAAPAPGCTIPVFRYALERWELTPYEITVFHEGPLPGELAELLDQLEAATPKTNSKIIRLDEAKPMTPAAAKVWRRHNPKSLPWFVVRLAEAEETQPDAWAGPLTAAALKQVVDSKARQTLVGHLSRGVSAVFVLLESGVKADDEAAAKLLQAELARITPLVKLPEQSADGPQLLTALPLKASFKTLRLSRHDPSEQGLVRMLLGTDADLDQVRGPIVFPVFGRGRALCSLFAEDLSGAQLHNVALFLCGECSCTVKELNPGVDLLLAADWPLLLREAEAELAKAELAKAELAETENSEPSETPVDVASNERAAHWSSAPSVETPAPLATAASAETAPVTSLSPVVESLEPTASVRWGFWLVAIGGACVLVLATGVWALAARK